MQLLSGSKRWVGVAVVALAATVLMAETPSTKPVDVLDPTLEREKKLAGPTTVPSFPHGSKENPVIHVEGVPDEITSPMGKKMTLRFSDEFNAVADKDGQPYIDRSKWMTTFWQGSSERTLGGNGEAQYYMDKDYAGKNNIPVEQRPNPFTFEEPGVLTISAFDTPKELWGNYWMGKERHYTSGMIISDKHFTFQHGFVEGRFKLPATRGSWPAFWMLCDDPRLGNGPKAHPWPPEVDVFEFFGHRPMRHSAGVHAKDKVKTFWGFHQVDIDITQDFHNFGFEWDENETVFTFDGQIWARGKTPPSLNRDMYLLVNLAVGGNWYSQEMKAAKTPHPAWEVDETTMPWKMKVDYVRVYQE